MKRIARHLQHHWRFYVAVTAGLLAWLALTSLSTSLRFILAGDSFFALYLILMAILTTRATLNDLRQRAAVEDEGIVLIVFITLAAIALALSSLLAFLEQGRPDPIHLGLALAGVPLGWITLHTIAAYHYAHSFYSDALARKRKDKDSGGLNFPNTQQPTTWDFLYFSFVIGMTAQVSDVQVTTTYMRRMILAHSVVSFFFNTILLALAVNIIAGQAS